MRFVLIFKRFLKSFALYFKLKHEFPAAIAFWMCYVTVLPSQKGKRYMDALTRYFRRELSELIERYRNKGAAQAIPSNKGKTPVWTCWLTGYDSMPEPVKICYHSLQKRVPGDRAALTLITEQNYRDYIEIPEYIVKKYTENVISPAHFSDVIRFCLLSRYGGMWLDATVYASGEIPIEFIDAPYYTQKARDKNAYPNEPSRAQWCGFIWAGKPGNPLFSFVRDALFQYWKEHDAVVDYIFFDYVILAAYHGLPEVRKMIDEQEPNNERIWDLLRLLNTPFDDQAYRQLCESNLFHKLTYKSDFKKTDERNRETYYGHLYSEVFH